MRSLIGLRSRDELGVSSAEIARRVSINTSGIIRSIERAERNRAGDEKLLGFFAGQAMKAMKGNANPRMLNDLLKKKLS